MHRVLQYCGKNNANVAKLCKSGGNFSKLLENTPNV